MADKVSKISTKKDRKWQSLAPKISNLGAKLKIIRYHFNLSQGDIMKLVCPWLPDSSSRSLISQYENGKREPSLMTILRYAYLSGISLETLLDDNIELTAFVIKAKTIKYKELENIKIDKDKQKNYQVLKSHRRLPAFDLYQSPNKENVADSKPAGVFLQKTETDEDLT